MGDRYDNDDGVDEENGGDTFADLEREPMFDPRPKREGRLSGGEAADARMNQEAACELETNPLTGHDDRNKVEL